MKASSIKKQAFDYELIAMAFHESGHAVCALYNILRVFNVHIVNFKNYDNSKLEGLTQWILPDPSNIENERLYKFLLLREVETCYAGLIAEKIYYKNICGSDNFPMHLRIGSSGDMKLASKLLKKANIVHPGKDTYEFKKKIQNNVYNILINQWDAITIVSHSLYKKKKLSFDELKFLLTRKVENKEFWKEKFKVISSIFDKELEESEIKSILFSCFKD